MFGLNQLSLQSGPVSSKTTRAGKVNKLTTVRSQRRWPGRSLPATFRRLKNKQSSFQKRADCCAFWSGRPLSGEILDLDHCFPWAVWPCSDLWNLMPAHRTVNQREKRSRPPADRLLRASRNRIISWWEAAYIQDQSSLSERFWLEAASSLPGVKAQTDSLNDHGHRPLVDHGLEGRKLWKLD